MVNQEENRRQVEELWQGQAELRQGLVKLRQYKIFLQHCSAKFIPVSRWCKYSCSAMVQNHSYVKAVQTFLCRGGANIPVLGRCKY